MSTVRLCPCCDLPLTPMVTPRGQSAFCPRCETRLYRGGMPSLRGDLALAITGLILFLPAHLYPLITIRLFGVMIPATIPSGTFALASDFPAVAVLILFCSSIAPFVVFLAVLGAHLGLAKRQLTLFKSALWCLEKLKHWAMFDVYLVSLGIACFKVKDYADIYAGPGLFCLVGMQLLIVVMLTRIHVKRYWERWQPETEHKSTALKLHCHTCHMSQAEGDRCLRCHSPIHYREPRSIQKTWAYLITGAIFIIPANAYPISIFLNNGKRLEDTILSGVATLINTGMEGIAALIFFASIIVPIAKILGLAFILLCIHFKRKINHIYRMRIYRIIQWIGKWSMMDLFVISIMVALIDRGQILDFTPGPGAIAFATVVVLTMLAAESLDPRLIWDNYDKK
ncbi:paraquat-inducible protein A [Photobacterium galatheae]|uniref:Paraquat-inducible protein A n=1 Tax=Photobacterium galatheae TaxID=1654360 RepID=A0A066RLE5_9GAMM|nr:paraquat-inducible protein A [Photobacterium galatheae]KDM91260.1 paraquat-inducible protein A [Photobacterium galatheae]MCM0150341.1 paraquat-inducible protein A [Photobacterium galatheae]